MDDLQAFRLRADARTLAAWRSRCARLVARPGLVFDPQSASGLTATRLPVSRAFLG